jgi:hypothetical protein
MNTDDVFFQRANIGNNISELHLVLGDDSNGAYPSIPGDSFMIGALDSANNSIWMPRFTFTGDGRLGVGTTTPAAKLDVNGDAKIGNSNTACSAANSGSMRWNGTLFEACNGTKWAPISNYGGVYTIGQSCNDNACRYPNPYTGDCSCPNGYKAHIFWEYLSNSGVYADNNKSCINGNQLHVVKSFACDTSDSPSAPIQYFPPTTVPQTTPVTSDQRVFEPHDADQGGLSSGTAGEGAAGAGGAPGDAGGPGGSGSAAGDGSGDGGGGGF